jgi:hypothetical protein
VASRVIDEKPSSPACLAHEADDAYMGFATKDEIAVFLKALDLKEKLDRADADAIRKMLPRIRDDMLHSELSARIKAIESTKSGT